MRSSPVSKNQFASDNYSGICPEAMEALAMASAGFANAYGEDDYTAKACNLIRDFFETDCEVFFAFNGTAANSLALASLCQSYHSIISHELAHIETDECGAVEFFSNGTKLLLAPGANGKVSPEAVEQIVLKRTDIHYPKPRVLSLTQSTEVGTVYSKDELAALKAVANQYGLRVHMDGARFGNALASLNCSAKEITWQAGVDVLTLGGTKAGLPVGEAVVFFNKELAEDFGYRCKQAGQLASKMRFLSAPWIGILETDAFRNRAAHANKCAARLAQELRTVTGITLVHPVQANAVFVQMPEALIDAIKQRGWHFYTFIGSGHARFMCNWATQPEDIEALMVDVREAAAAL
ncbi:threonine aldolase family protein [Reinekea marinisedimentorum]|uniref:L-threonine aldolase n=1 Tax=Reinekea marinisedimentorum TaxID=230495 RepID=A0A4R3ICM1_9GAMM|nr:low specificity L-threonine aldolase [Reinekea marinisedimentorum]TCS43316.1 L-threonine aldolase [Reinekea marinisedimentorum]